MGCEYFFCELSQGFAPGYFRSVPPGRIGAGGGVFSRRIAPLRSGGQRRVGFVASPPLRRGGQGTWGTWICDEAGKKNNRRSLHFGRDDSFLGWDFVASRPFRDETAEWMGHKGWCRGWRSATAGPSTSVGMTALWDGVCDFPGFQVRDPSTSLSGRLWGTRICLVPAKNKCGSLHFARAGTFRRLYSYGLRSGS